MKIFELPGGMDAVREFNEARQARRGAQDDYRAAQLRNWVALVRMAKAHKRVTDIAGSDDTDIFVWCDLLDGNRDEILRGAETPMPEASHEN